MATTAEMQPLAPAGYRRAPEMKEKVEASMVDLEAGNGETLYPGISRGESALRWGFVRKVYGILAAQLILTTAVSALTVLHPTLNATLSTSPGLARACRPALHLIGVACANTEGRIVLEALILTAGVVASLTAYAFWAAKKGKEFGYLGPILFSGLTILVLTSFVQIFIPLGPVSVAVFGGLGALVFSGFILYDTESLIKRHTYDEYIWASVGLYLDILNLFLTILNILRSMQSDN
ncbi:hypothetical protein PR202_gb01058 [Eleusine coracana subsp. coracana]|uniref:BI1-like protein n=1 Tax=Eleusine coracana subsp. coracana TaxID=191504 RepID=A0AAV5DU47_ELECO|nr:hypothetical protein PR202_gb01058 [Eleusine coracana subsp. coracana]